MTHATGPAAFTANRRSPPKYGTHTDSVSTDTATRTIRLRTGLIARTSLMTRTPPGTPLTRPLGRANGGSNLLVGYRFEQTRRQSCFVSVFARKTGNSPAEPTTEVSARGD